MGSALFVLKINTYVVNTVRSFGLHKRAKFIDQLNKYNFFINTGIVRNLKY